MQTITRVMDAMLRNSDFYLPAKFMTNTTHKTFGHFEGFEFIWPILLLIKFKTIKIKTKFYCDHVIECMNYKTENLLTDIH